MWKDVLTVVGTEQFGETLNEAITRNGLTIKEFAEKYDIPKSTLYKITSGSRIHFNTKLLRQIIDGLREEEAYSEDTIGLITTRDAVDRAPTVVQKGDVRYEIKPLPASTIEEEIIRGVNAEKNGIDGILCGPIAATTLEKVVDVPVAGLQFDASLIQTSLEDFIERIS